MAGIRVGGVAVISSLSFPYTVIDSDAVNDVWRIIGTTPTNLTNFPVDDTGFSEKWNPVVAPDESVIVYSALNSDTFEYELWSIPATGGSPTLLKSDATNPLMFPYWAPDSSHFLYINGVGGNNGGDVRRMDPDGSNDTLILAAGAGEQLFRPQYNADATLIVFARRVNTGPVYTLRVMEDDGSNEVSVRTLDLYAAEGSQYAFANTSNRIAFFDGDVNTECYTVDPDGTDLTQISTGGDNYRISKYSWLPDDSLVLGMAFIDPGAGQHWFPVSFDPAGGPTQVVLEDTEWAGVYTSRRQGWLWQNRFWFLLEAGANPVELVSINTAGGNFRVDHDVSAPPTSGAFSPGNGPEYV